jgi:hypothetical protein
VSSPEPDEFEEIEVVPVALDELREDLRAAAPRYVTDVSSALALRIALARLAGSRPDSPTEFPQPRGSR